VDIAEIFSLAVNNLVRLPNRVSKSRAKSTALFPFTPVRRKIARSSASESDAAPRWSNFSRGRSAVGQSVMLMFVHLLMSVRKNYCGIAHFNFMQLIMTNHYSPLLPVRTDRVSAR